MPCRGTAGNSDRSLPDIGGTKGPAPLTNKAIPKLSTENFLCLWITPNLDLRFTPPAALIEFHKYNHADPNRSPKADRISGFNRVSRSRTKTRGTLCRKKKTRWKRHGLAPICCGLQGHMKNISATARSQNVPASSCTTAPPFQSRVASTTGRTTRPPDRTGSRKRLYRVACRAAWQQPKLPLYLTII